MQNVWHPQVKKWKLEAKLSYGATIPNEIFKEMKTYRVLLQATVVMLLVCVQDLYAGRRHTRQIHDWFGSPRGAQEGFTGYEDITPVIRPFGGYDAEYPTTGALIDRGAIRTTTILGRTRPGPVVISKPQTKIRRCLLYSHSGLCLYLSKY
ncbi:uncharacterized protein LOC125029030 [Penaeus chinensis]|uniref:uncharacterized protein LOC125029030 n=1 Tax=Penaeus chinensis TaxID=139456 RepID=UPI001FB72863|nr:uncharacterized protein LOC125029030 [Penaeus chinensis]XP_047474715.1 uncharacterized protein LOC125029030 [Penaeus chinensis]